MNDSRRTVLCMLCMATGWILLALPRLMAAPVPNDELQLTAVMFTGDELGGPNSNYNPRHFAGSNFVNQINNTKGTIRYPAGSGEAAAVVSLAAEGESRMWSPMDGGTSTQWVLLAGGADEPLFSRLPYDAEDTDDRVFAGADDHEPNSFDWVDADTIIYSSYEYRNMLYLADVTADPFAITPNTAWNPDGAVETDAGRIRNVRVGDVYNTHAYYAEAAVADNARIWALDLATGGSTLVTQIESVSGDGSWGLWTIKEVDGYAFVHTSHDGIYVYEMQDATHFGSLVTQYTKQEIDDFVLEAGGAVTPNWGFDVAENGRLMLIGGNGTVIELSGPVVSVPGDFNGDGVLDAADINDLTTQPTNGNEAKYDLNGDSLINEQDIRFWVKDLFGSWIGDANLDHEFSSTDLVEVLAAGTYETDLNAVWTTGDFNGDGRANSGDLVAALADGGYELGPPVAAVPEPGSVGLLLGCLALLRRPRSHTRPACGGRG